MPKLEANVQWGRVSSPQPFFRTFPGDKKSLEQLPGGSGPYVPQRTPERPRRSQAGYTPRGRVGKVILKTVAEPELRDEFNKFATEDLGVTAQLLLLHLAKSAVKAKSDPAFVEALRATLRKEAKRHNEVREIVLSTVSSTVLKHALS